MSKVTSDKLTTGEVVVMYSLIDNKKDKTLVLVHGNSSSGRFWEALMETRLQTFFNFLVFDLPGHGKSPVPNNPQENYSLSAYVDIITQLITELELKNYFLLGHSLGGHIVLESMDRLSNCAGAATIGTPPLTAPPQLEKAFVMSPQFISFMQSGTDREAIKETFKSMISSGKSFLADLLFEDYWKTDPQARTFLIQNISQGKFNDEVKILQKTKIPVYIFASEQDEMVDPAYFKTFIPDQEVIFIPEAGHYVPLVKPEAFAELLLKKMLD